MKEYSQNLPLNVGQAIGIDTTKELDASAIYRELSQRVTIKLSELT